MGSGSTSRKEGSCTFTLQDIHKRPAIPNNLFIIADRHNSSLNEYTSTTKITRPLQKEHQHKSQSNHSIILFGHMDFNRHIHI